ncbi:MAG: right-handed parallel beta-helix repeat-containing protein [Nitrospiraceae bacterium]|nr:MAG: right-handed parallel beta-helix repeat-containing protein [Nitrospiraceae bacterium]
MNKFAAIFIFLFLLFLNSPAHSMVLTSNATWSGEVAVDQDTLVPEGVTLTILPGTIIRIMPSESTKTEPEFLSPQTEITVRGTLVADGTESSPVTFHTAGEKRSDWAGIIVDGGKVSMRFSVVRDAETGIDLIKGSVSLRETLLVNNRYGLIVQGRDAAALLEASKVQENDYGVFLLNGAKIESRDSIIKGNRKRDSYSADAKEYLLPLKEYKVKDSGKEKARVYGDDVLLGSVVWQGRIEVNGIIRVPENSRLIIMPGTVVEFRKKDANNDGIGENGLLIQGNFIAKGTREQPIFFRSAGKQRGMTDWDSINILNSDRTQNLIEHCQIENAYRGLHFHFSNVAVTESVLRNNERGIQFQESIVEIRGTHFYGNKSVLWARDSEIIFSDNAISHNYSGINLFRNTLAFKDNLIINNDREGLRIREGIPIVERNLLDGNRYGLMIVDTVYGNFSNNVISHNLESGVALRGADNIDFSGNVVQGNGLNGIVIQESSASIRGNLISDNGERGIGVLSFHGTITENNILKNGLYNLGIDGTTDVAAQKNWWGDGDVKSAIYDKENDPAKGKAEYVPFLKRPVIVTWPLKDIYTDTIWHGDIGIDKTINVMPGIHLAIMPYTRVMFSQGAGLHIKGKITAKGEKDAGITFTSLKNGEASDAWDEILLDHADGSVFTNCIFENSTWALHVHFTSLVVEGCTFMKNYGGMRFRSGPIEITHSSFRENEIGLRSNAGNALIAGNSITANRIGIFVREKGSGLSIKKNNLFANDEYNIRLGDFNDEDVDARDNWWGEGLPADTIFDARQEPGIGTVNYKPYARQPFITGPIQAMSRSKENIQIEKGGTENK